MKISAKTKDCSLMVKVKTTAREKIDEKELDRFARVYLRCFLKPKLAKSNSAEYTGPIGIPLKDRLKKEITKRDFLFILEYIVVAVQKLNGNNFPICCLSMDMQYIYINETTKELQFLYVPLIGQQKSGNIVELLSSLIYMARPAAEKDTEYISRFNYFFKSLKPFDINKVEQFVQHEDRSVVNTIKKHNAGQSGFMTSDHKHYYDHMDEQRRAQDEEAKRQVVRPGELDKRMADADATGLLTEAGDAAYHFSSFVETAGPGNGFVETAGPGTGFVEAVSHLADSEDATGLLTEAGDAAYHFSSFAETAGPGNGFVETAGPGTGFVEAASHFADSEDATGLLTEAGDAAYHFSSFAETAGPGNGFVETAGPGTGFVEAASHFADSEDATGLLTEAGDAAYHFSSFAETAGPGNGFVETAGPGTGFVEAASHFADSEDATGLLTDDPRAPGYFDNAAVTGHFDEEATCLLVDADDTGTTLLEEKSVTPTVVYPELHRVLTGEIIPVNKPVFRLGKERSYVDYFVTNNNAVSRSHADIITRGNVYFVVDLNSKNRTFINNQAIAAQTETAIRDGDLLRLGNEEFVFRIAGSQRQAVPLRCPNCNTQINPGSIFCHHCGRRVRN